MQRRLLTIFALAVVMCLPITAMAVPTITAGNHVFQEGVGNVSFDILAGGGDGVQGVDLLVFTGTNGGDLTGNSPDAPTIVSVDVVGAGTIFQPNNTGQNNITVGTNIYQGGTTTGTGTVAADGVLAHVTIDITGWAIGVYPLWVSDANPLFGDGLLGSAYSQQITSAADGTITIVPEPSSIVLGLFAAAGMAAMVIRRRRSA